MQPGHTGLYNPRYEHDACGIGAVVRISGRKDHALLESARDVLLNMQHRGASGGDENTGDGAGILFQLPDAFLASEARSLGFALPPAGYYGLAMLFLPQDPTGLESGRRCFEGACEAFGLRILGWRQVPTRNDSLGAYARATEPRMLQAFIDGGGLTGDALEHQLFRARKRAERGFRERPGASEEGYVVSCSCRTVVYKGMFLAPQLFDYFPDLAEPTVISALAVVHQRYSTNTFPSWRLAQPFRMVAHNGEINTLQGNLNLMRAVEKSLGCQGLGCDPEDLFPIVQPGGSDSAAFDNTLELLVQGGRSLPHSMMMMIPEAFPENRHMGEDLRGFYEYHGALMEPWDGPAAMIFTDGILVGAALDRSGLRPCRYAVTSDGLLVMASEAGVIELPAEQVRLKGKLGPGRMILADTAEGRILHDFEIKSRIARRKPYRRWLEQNRISLRGLLGPGPVSRPEGGSPAARLRAFGYSQEDVDRILTPMAVEGHEPVGSMGTDTPLAVLSERPKLLFDYFKQMFAQVTNPPLDSQWEGLVMSLLTFTGRHRDLLEESPEHARVLELRHPILSNEDMARLRALKRVDFKVATVDLTFPLDREDPGGALAAAVARVLEEAERAILEEDASLLILSDRNEAAGRLPIPSLLAVSALHEHLLVRGLLGQAGFVVESGEPREVAHIGLLCGFGASGVNPYLALECLSHLAHEGRLPSPLEPEALHDNYILALKKGLLKIMSKMGISTLPSYRGAQLFQAIGLGHDLVARYFPGIASPLGGADLDVLAREGLARHDDAYGEREPAALALGHGGEYAWRDGGESHLWDPASILQLQQAVRQGDDAAYRRFAELINRQDQKCTTLRSLLDFVPGEPVPLAEVEPVGSIVRRFCAGAMSHGSLSAEAHETIAIAMNHLGAASNTGEGGEDPARYRVSPDGEDRNSAIKQVASARFGVTIEYLANAQEIQIKMAQGAKPGEGGQLPGHKVTAEIAHLRHSTPGVTLISPPPHHDIYSIEELAQLIHDLRCANPTARVSVKLVSELGVGTVAAGVVKAGADEVLVSGFDGGTGASPLSSMKHAGLPWELGLAEVQQTLLVNGLRSRVTVQTDGQLRTGRDVVIAALLGAERFGFGAGILVSLGCILLRKCHEGGCTAGIATQREELRRHFAGQPLHVERYLTFVAEEIRERMAELGFRRFEELVGRTDRLIQSAQARSWKAGSLDLSPLLVRPPSVPAVESAARSVLAGHPDWDLLERLESTLEKASPARLELGIRNVHRSVGTLLSYHITRLHGGAGLPDGTLELCYRGSAGQSFGAFQTHGVTMRLEGEANDHLGKGLCGGRIVVRVAQGAPFRPEENHIAGNSLLYGATAGEAFLNGLAGERFAVRNSGAIAVVEGVGDHGCEYMTGGIVVVLGRTGRNFAAGMTGGIAYVLDENQIFDTLCNLDTVNIEGGLAPDEDTVLRSLVERHFEWTRSPKARRLLEAWPDAVGRFVKVVPLECGRNRSSRTVRADDTDMMEEVVHGKA